MGRMIAIRKSSGIRRIQEFLSILDSLAQSRKYRFLASEGFLETADGWRDKRITKTCQYVFDHLAENISLKDVARIAGMNPQSFCRFFRKMTGQALFSFVNRTRIGHACALLIDTDVNISEACYASGFNNLSNFNRRFREIKGTSPRLFLRQYRAEQR
jgi:AraC-like DNA-binding protein